jgi:hypothetical protein
MIGTHNVQHAMNTKIPMPTSVARVIRLFHIALFTYVFLLCNYPSPAERHSVWARGAGRELCVEIQLEMLIQC